MTMSGGAQVLPTKVDHLVVPLLAGPGARKAARLALQAARRRARRLTLLLLSSGPLNVLDTTCRQLAATLHDGTEDACEVRVVVRTGAADVVLGDVLARDPADLVLLPAEIEEEHGRFGVLGCPVLSLEPDLVGSGV